MERITMRSSETGEARSAPLIDDACQMCARVGVVTLFAPEDWRVCVDCLEFVPTGWYTTSPVPQEARELADPGEPTLFANEEQRLALTPVERSIIRHAVRDNAATFHGGPLHFGEFDSARYTAETYVYNQLNERRVNDERDQLSLAETIYLTLDEIRRQPGVLDRRHTNKELDERNRKREEAAREIVKSAFELGLSNAKANALINLAEAMAPLAQTVRGFDYLRSLVDKCNERV